MPVMVGLGVRNTFLADAPERVPPIDSKASKKETFVLSNKCSRPFIRIQAPVLPGPTTQA